MSSPSVLLAGVLFKAPEIKTAKASGKSFVVATLKVPGGNEMEFWTAIVFSENAQSEILRLGPGDRMTVQGSLKIELFIAKDGKPRINRTCVADHVLALRQPPRERKPRPDRHAPSLAPEQRDLALASTAPPFDDDLPVDWGAR
jgi:single-stranded DNA-binding protein